MRHNSEDLPQTDTASRLTTPSRSDTGGVGILENLQEGSRGAMKTDSACGTAQRYALTSSSGKRMGTSRRKRQAIQNREILAWRGRTLQPVGPPSCLPPQTHQPVSRGHERPRFMAGASELSEESSHVSRPFSPSSVVVISSLNE